MCFRSEISEVVEKTFFLVPGRMHCKFIHFVPQPEFTDGSEINVMSGIEELLLKV
jgi:hypothetical protein